MAHGKVSNRQKMINLMYLIFIAMLALNVDREVLRSFEGINTTLEQSTKLTDQNNATFYTQIDNKAKEDEDYVETATQAKEVKAKTDAFVASIEQLKSSLGYVKPVGEEESDYNALQDTYPIQQLFFEGGTENKGNSTAQKFEADINAYKDFLMKYATSDSDKSRLNDIFSTAAIGKKPWIREVFYNQPMVSALTNLTKLESDARTEEGNIVRALLAGKLEDKIELNAFQGIILAPGVVKVGEKVPVTVALGAYDNSITGVANTTAGSVNISGGKGTFDLNTSAVGEKTITGSITYKASNGVTKTIPIAPVKYSVVSDVVVEQPKGGTITADNMNVVYRGVVNPMSASVSGGSGGVNLTASTGSLSSAGAGKWNYNPGAGQTVTFTVTGKTGSGKTITDTREFRIKPIPPARGNIGGQTTIAIPANGLAGQTLKVDWPDFLFPINATVNSFKVKVPGQPTAVVNGTSMSGASGALGKAKKGDVIGIFDIKYKTNTGIEGTASSVNIEVR